MQPLSLSRHFVDTGTPSPISGAYVPIAMAGCGYPAGRPNRQIRRNEPHLVRNGHLGRARQRDRAVSHKWDQKTKGIAQFDLHQATGLVRAGRSASRRAPRAFARASSGQTARRQATAAWPYGFCTSRTGIKLAPPPVTVPPPVVPHPGPPETPQLVTPRISALISSVFPEWSNDWTKSCI